MKLRLPLPLKRLDRWQLGPGLFPWSHEVFQVGAHLQARPGAGGSSQALPQAGEIGACRRRPWERVP